MTLGWQPTRWEAEDDLIVGTISRVGGGYAWEVFSKLEQAVITAGECGSLAVARKRCWGVSVTIRDAECG